MTRNKTKEQIQEPSAFSFISYSTGNSNTRSNQMCTELDDDKCYREKGKGIGIIEVLPFFIPDNKTERGDGSI